VTAFELVATYCRFEMLDHLLSNAYIADKINSFCVLHICCGFNERRETFWDGKEKCVSLLKSNIHTDVNNLDSAGHTALYYAAQLQTNNILRLLLQHNDVDVNHCSNMSDTPLMRAVWQQHAPNIRSLVQHPHIDVNKRRYDNATALIKLCVSTSTIEELLICARQLLNHDNINVNCMDENGETAVLEHEDFSLLDSLLIHGRI
jgi:ankyrin repeat protein